MSSVVIRMERLSGIELSKAMEEMDALFRESGLSNVFSAIIDSAYFLLKNNMNVRSLKNVTNTLCVIIGFEKFYGKLDDEHKKIF